MPNDDSSNLPSIFSKISIPHFLLGPAGEALSRLIGRAAEIPSAKLDALTQAIRDETEARSIVTRALANAVAGKAITDAGIVDRAMASFVDKEFRKQENKDSVAHRAAELLIDASPPLDGEVKAAAPDPDWMNVFEVHAENASTERMQEIWARVLAGEIRKPQSFSLKTLGFISQLDQSVAQTFEKYAQCVFLGNALPRKDNLQGKELSELLHLEEFGLVTGVGGFLQKTITIEKDRSGQAISFASGHVALIRKEQENPTDIKLAIPSILLTNVGKQILSILNPPFDIELARGALEVVPKENLMRISCFDIVSRQEGEIIWQQPAS